MARILAKALNCTDLHDGEPCDVCPSCVAIREGRALDVSEMDAASNNRVDDMRELLPRIYTTPSDLKRKVFIVDEVQRIREGWDVLLKTLEEPPDHVVFVFCTTDASQIRPAVLSRVQRFDFRRMTVPEISGKLRTILTGDGREAEPEAIDLIARLAAGGMRDAESMLDQLLTTDSGPLTAGRVREVLGLVEDETVEAFLLALVGGQALVGIDLLDELEEHGRDLRAFTDQAIERLRGALVVSLGRGPQSGLASIGPIALAASARRLSSIDPSRQGPGGLRLQLELALLEPSPTGGQWLPETAAQTTASAPPERSTPTPTPTALGRSTPTPIPTAPEGSKAPVRASAPLADHASGVMSPTTPPVPRPTNGPTLQLLLERWAEVVEVISKNPPTKPLIVACRPVAVEGSVVTLGFPEAQSFFKDVAERRRAVLEEGVSRVLGIPVTVRCVAANVEVAHVPEDPDGARLLTEFRRIYGDDAADVKDID
jgi:DNA polymerase-3 subunit gamma/tau